MTKELSPIEEIEEVKDLERTFLVLIDLPSIYLGLRSDGDSHSEAMETLRDLIGRVPKFLREELERMRKQK